MLVRKVVTGLLLTAGAFVMITGTATAQEDPLVRVNSPVDQNIVRVENNADGAAVSSPGITGGTIVQVPVEVPVNVCGNTINVVGLLNPAHGNVCVNE